MAGDQLCVSGQVCAYYLGAIFIKKNEHAFESIISVHCAVTVLLQLCFKSLILWSTSIFTLEYLHSSLLRRAEVKLGLPDLHPEMVYFLYFFFKAVDENVAQGQHLHLLSVLHYF